jgi:coatomer protein complex subunit epsilon
VSQAVAEIHLGRLEEAEAALQQALVKDPQNAEVIANLIVLNVIAGKDAKELTRYKYFATQIRFGTDFLSSLSSASPNHALLQDLQEKSEAFDKAALKYTAKA